MNKLFILLVVFAGLTLALPAQAQAACPTGVNHCANLSWTPGTVSGNNAATSFNIYRTVTSGACSVVSAAGCSKSGSAAVPTDTFTDSPLAATTTYFWVVTAVNSAGESAPSNQVTATTGQDPTTTPATPTGVSVIAK